MSEVAAERALRSLTEEVMRNYWRAIEERLQELVAGGTVITRLALEHHPDMETRITIDHVPVATFKIIYPETSD